MTLPTVPQESGEQQHLDARTELLRFAAIIEDSTDAIISKDLNGIITSWNKGAERIFGYTASEIIGKPIATLAPPEVINEMPQILDKIRRGQRVEHYETRRRTKTGEIIDVALTVSPIKDEAGQVIGASKIARDITERKRIEAERAEWLAREQEARKTAELLNRVGPTLAAQLDLPTLVQSVTDIATELLSAEFGTFAHNVVNEQGESYTLHALSGVPSDASASFPTSSKMDVFALTFRSEGIVRSDDVTQDSRYAESPPYFGMPQWPSPIRSYLAAPVIARSGELLGGLFFGHSKPGKFSAQHEAILGGIAAQAAIAIDNARLFEQARRAQHELKRANDELQHANRDLETFAYSASHDLQEPLRTIAISAQLLERRCQTLDDEAHQLLTGIIQGADRMKDLVSDILAYATVTRHPESPLPAVDANQVVATVLETMSASINEAGAVITAGTLPVVSMHEKHLAQVLQNLCSNALKYRSEAFPRINISATEQNGLAVFSVVDNGIGIEPRFAERIFGLFNRLHNRSEYPGSGIGLAICQRIVEQYGGRIWLEHSAPGQGSTFRFTVPLHGSDPK
jgi:PAS domain S-box-containing protein